MASNPYPLWIPYAKQYPVKYRNPQQGMKFPILGVLLHTTNAPKGEQTIARFQRDWPGSSGQSAHFVIDRQGEIGQCRTTSEVAWHAGKGYTIGSTRYFGIEFIAFHKDPRGLTSKQKESAYRLIGDLSVIFGFPVKQMTKLGEPGIGVHSDFKYTGCGEGIFWSGHKSNRTLTYRTILSRASSYALLGYCVFL